MKLPSRQQVTAFLSHLTEKGLVLLVVLYIIFSVGRSVMKNYNVNQKIDSLKNQIAVLDAQLAYLKNLIAYYQTDTFKELKAREELGFQRPGEHVLSVPVEPEDLKNNNQNGFIAVQPPDERPLPNYVKWYNYFFGG